MTIKQINNRLRTSWKRMQLQDIAKTSSGGTPNSDNPLYYEGGNIPWLTSGEVRRGRVSTFENFITKEGLENSSAKVFPVGTVLVAMYGATAGQVGILEKESATNQAICGILPNDKYTPLFLYYFFFRKTNELLLMGSGAAQPNISQEILRSYDILLPPLPEQNRIVAVLETWDKAIEKLTKKIEIKKQIKKGLMQELLTGKTRLPGFKGEWKTVKLGDVCEINPKSTDLPNTFVYIDLESVEQGTLLTENEINLINAPSRAQRLLKSGDVLFQMVRPYQKNNLFFEADGNYVASTGYAQIRAIGSARYLYYLVHMNDFVNEVIDRCTGSNYPAINSTDLANIEIVIPVSKDEQVAIANVLTSSDKEIQQLTKKLSLLKDQKKYLLNNLINGIIRTPENMKIQV